MEKSGRATFQPADVLERALMQLLRDTNNRYSVARYHSLLRDMYGGDGLYARVYPVVGQNPVFIQANFDAAFMPRYAGAAVGVAGDLGPTNGQLVDFFVREVHRPSSGDARVLEDDNAVGLDLDENGLPIDHEFSRVGGYYNGWSADVAGRSLRGAVGQGDRLRAPGHGTGGHACHGRDDHHHHGAFPRDYSPPCRWECLEIRDSPGAFGFIHPGGLLRERRARPRVRGERPSFQTARGSVSTRTRTLTGLGSPRVRRCAMRGQSDRVRRGGSFT